MKAFHPTFTGLDTRVAVRTFAMFCLCAVVPIVLSAYIADDLVSRKFREFADARLAQASKSYGLMIFQRLKETDATLGELADSALRGELTLQNLRSLRSPHFRIVAVQDAAPATRAPTPSLTVLQTPHEPAVSMTISRVADRREIWITALLDSDYLWDTSGAELQPMQICVRTESGVALRCSGDAESGTGPAAARIDSEWVLYLRPQYGTQAWSVRSSQQADTALAGLHEFRRTLPIMTLIAVVVASLLSVVQVRRSHRPLALLVEAASRVGRQRFDTRLKIDSKDEYQYLARAFNRMAAGLARRRRRSRRRLAVEQRLRVALQEGSLQLAFQPKIRLADGAVHGVEALARWTDAELGAVPPSVFIPVAEQCGLIDELGSWALRTACETFQTWLRDGRDVGHVSVNASIRQLRGRQFVQEVLNVIRDTGIRPSALEIEMTESTLADRPDEVAHVLQELRAIGVRIAIDDFGTGYSSMAALAHLPIDVVKIDRSFVTDCATRPEAVLLVEAVISMAHVLGKVTVAEGVETQAQLTALRQLGCDAVQGYLFARPMSAAALWKLPLRFGDDDASRADDRATQRRVAPARLTVVT